MMTLNVVDGGLVARTASGPASGPPWTAKAPPRTSAPGKFDVARPGYFPSSSSTT